MLELHKIASVINKYSLNGVLIKTEDYGYGNINKTIKITTLEGDLKHHYILQKINNKLFVRVDKLMQNIESITEHIRQKVIDRGGDSEREVLTIVKTKQGKTYCKHKNEYYRIYKYVSDSVCLQTTDSTDVFEKVGVAYGLFQEDLSDFDASTLYEILPNFHNTAKRYKDFQKQLLQDKYNRIDGNQEMIKNLLSRKNYANIICDQVNNHFLPLRVTHNDTKLNNVVLDKDSMRPVCVLDLDTVMPATLCYDFGDAVRYGCNTLGELTTDFKNIKFDLSLFSAFTNGYIQKLYNHITQNEVVNLAISAIIMTYELCLRFLTDYLGGDKYFGAKYPTQNLDRAKVQFYLLIDMEKKFDDMQSIVKDTYNNYKEKNK